MQGLAFKAQDDSAILAQRKDSPAAPSITSRSGAGGIREC
jgi:hypothetical protein